MPFNNSSNNLFRENKVVNSAVDYAALADDVIINMTNTSSPRHVTLPMPSSENVGKKFFIKDTSGSAETNNITVKSALGDIDGKESYILNRNFSSLEVYSDGKNYYSTAPIFKMPKVHTPDLIKLPSFKARKSMPLTIPTDVYTPILHYNTPDFDIAKSFASYSGVFTAPRDARYLCIGSLIFMGAVDNDNFFIVCFNINGNDSLDRGAQIYSVKPTSNTYPIAQVTTIFNLEKGDKVKLVGFQNTGKSVSLRSDIDLNSFAVQELQGDL